MLRQQVKSVGISLLDRIQKPYDFRVARIWATNGKGDDFLWKTYGHMPQPPDAIPKPPEPEPIKEPEKILM